MSRLDLPGQTRRRPDTARGVPAQYSWELSECSKTTPVLTNERNTRNENFQRSKTMVAQSHVRQADDAQEAME